MISLGSYKRTLDKGRQQKGGDGGLGKGRKGDKSVTREIAQSIHCLPCKHRGPKFNLQDLHKEARHPLCNASIFRAWWPASLA